MKYKLVDLRLCEHLSSLLMGFRKLYGQLEMFVITVYGTKAQRKSTEMADQEDLIDHNFRFSFYEFELE